MKKLLSLLLAAAAALPLAACGAAGGPPAPSPSPAPGVEAEWPATGGDSDSQVPEGAGESNILVAYFSWADNSALDGDVDAVSSPSVIPPGNVQQLASWVQ